MCNYSEMVEARTSVDNIRSLMRHLNFTEEEAMDALEFTGEKRELYASMLEEERNTENP